MNRSQMKAQKKTQQKKVAKKPVKKVTKRTLTTKKQATKKGFQPSPAQFKAPAFAPSFAAMSAPFSAARMTTLSRRFYAGKMFFTEDHEYIKFDSDNTAYVGISNHAQELLGEIVYVELPEKDQSYNQHEPFCSIESVKSSNNVYAPANMRILKINDALTSQPELINEDPHGEGWIAHVYIDNTSRMIATNELMNPETYEKFCV